MKLTLILLAAGNSRRFDGNKLLTPFHGKPMYQYIVEEVEKLPDGLFDDKIVVTQYPEIMEDLEKRGYVVVENVQSSLGISHSIHLALEAAASPDGEEASYCFAVCDQPYLKAATIEGLIEGWRNSKRGIGCLCNMGEFLALEGDVGGKRVLRMHIDDLYLHEVDDGLELVDIDVRG